MPGFIDVTTDKTGPANSYCPPSVCCSITVPTPGSDQRTWILDKAPVTGGHEVFSIDDKWFYGASKIRVGVILYWGATQWSIQDDVIQGQTYKVTRYFGAYEGTPECTPGDTKCDPDGNIWVCSPSTGIWLRTSTPCGTTVLPEIPAPTTVEPSPAPWEPLPTTPVTTTTTTSAGILGLNWGNLILIGVLGMVVLISLAMLMRRRST